MRNVKDPNSNIMSKTSLDHICNEDKELDETLVLGVMRYWPDSLEEKLYALQCNKQAINSDFIALGEGKNVFNVCAKIF